LQVYGFNLYGMKDSAGTSANLNVNGGAGIMMFVGQIVG
jgi:hypothetical protein